MQNVSEWAKRKDCWEKAKTTGISLRQDFEKELVFRREKTEAEKDAKDIQKQDNRVSGMIAVANYGAKNREKVFAWGIENRVFNSTEISLLKRAVAMETSTVFPSGKQCSRILKILEKAYEKSYRG